VTGYLAEAYRRNADAEVSGLELERELGLSRDRVRECLEYLVREGLAQGDLFLVNVWVRLTPEGAALASDQTEG